jgi:hypothetical protein
LPVAIMLTKTSIQKATRKSIVDHCSSFVVAMLILCVLARYKDTYPLNCLLLFIWMLALFASVLPACLIILSHQGVPDNEAEDIFPVSINDLDRKKLSEILNYVRPNLESIREQLMKHKTLISRAAIMTLSLSISLIVVEVQCKISTGYLSSHFSMCRSAISCWWIYSLLSGLRFGGYAIAESQHRLATPYD